MNSLGAKQSFHREKFKGKIKINNPYEYKSRTADEIDTSIYKNPPIEPKSPTSVKSKRTNIRVRDTTLKVFEDLNRESHVDPVAYRKTLFKAHNEKRATYSKILNSQIPIAELKASNIDPDIKCSLFLNQYFIILKYYEDLNMVPDELRKIMIKLDKLLHIYTTSLKKNPHNNESVYSLITYISDINAERNDLLSKYNKLKENYSVLLEEITKKKNTSIPSLMADIKILTKEYNKLKEEEDFLKDDVELIEKINVYISEETHVFSEELVALRAKLLSEHDKMMIIDKQLEVKRKKLDDIYTELLLYKYTPCIPKEVYDRLYQEYLKLLKEKAKIDQKLFLQKTDLSVLGSKVRDLKDRLVMMQNTVLKERAIARSTTPRPNWKVILPDEEHPNTSKDTVQKLYEELKLYNNPELYEEIMNLQKQINDLDEEAIKLQEKIDKYEETHPEIRYDKNEDGTLMPLSDITMGLKPLPDTPQDLITDTPSCTRVFAKRDIMQFALGLWKYKMDRPNFQNVPLEKIMSSFIYNTFGIKGIVATYRKNYIYGLREYIGHPHIQLTYLILIGVFPEVLYIDMLNVLELVRDFASYLSTNLFSQIVDYLPVQLFVEYLPQLFPKFSDKTIKTLKRCINEMFMNNKLLYIPKLMEYHKIDYDNPFIKEIQVQYIKIVKEFIVNLFSHIRMLSNKDHYGKCKIREIRKLWLELDTCIPNDILDERIAIGICNDKTQIGFGLDEEIEIEPFIQNLQNSVITPFDWCNKNIITQLGFSRSTITAGSDGKSVLASRKSIVRSGAVLPKSSESSVKIQNSVVSVKNSI